jgi:general secretion pathway protein F
MAAFEYQALDAGGRNASGVLEADTARAARSLLRERGLTPLEVAPVREQRARAATLHWRRRALDAARLAEFTRQLATLIGAGLPIDEALAALGEQESEPRVQALVAQLRSRVMEGKALAQALSEFPGEFSEAYRASVAAGESSGRLGEVLSRLADQAEAREQFGRQLFAALAYPALLASVAIAVAAGLLVYVVPQVVSVFDNLGQRLPLITRVLIAIADFTRTFGLLALVLLVLALIGMRVALRRESVRARWDAFMLRLPLIGRLQRAADTARAARTLATLVGSGVPVLEALRLAAQTVQNLPMREALRRAAVRVREGGGIARALAASDVFAPVTVRLIASGEKSGELDAMLQQAARQQQREVDAALATMTAVLGPVVILMVGGLVLFIVLAILLPIFELNTLIR